MHIVVSKTKSLVLSCSPDLCILLINREAVKLVERFKYVGLELTYDGKWEWETHMRSEMAGCVLRVLLADLIKAELTLNYELPVFKWIFILMLI
ncbi:unnamed protein product [Soboliphyme baturini]|uniref:Ovule protein n=1 Tax=Soboliphyme baturini TaxID=241478 RepID=A0A183IBK6_9BILA|nr:unnamed protein product [Soboliphyme baturini]